jgi:hypothetical protein
MRTPFAVSLAVILTTSPLAYAQNEPTVRVGPWTIATVYKADKFDSCTMGRSADGLEIGFALTRDGLLLMLDSPKWKLERGKAYTVRLAAGALSIDAKALADTKSVTIPLADSPFNGKLRSSSMMEVRGEGATLRVPLDGSTAALDRLDVCFEKNSRESAQTNPFVAPSRKP